MKVSAFFKTSYQRPNTIDLEDGMADLAEQYEIR